MKQSHRACNHKFNDFLMKDQLTQSVVNVYVYCSFLHNFRIILSIYVDSALLFYFTDSNIFGILAYMNYAIEHTQGYGKYYIGIWITQDHVSWQSILDQQHHAIASQISTKFGWQSLTHYGIWQSSLFPTQSATEVHWQ